MQPVQVSGASSGWKEQFQTLGQRLRQCLGDLALRIDHIGSTSIPGLAAKDIIDVQVTVNALDFDLLEPAFDRAGFMNVPHNVADHRPAGARATDTDSDWSKLFFSPKAGRPTHVHVRVMGRPNQRYALLFRDYLRTHPNAAGAYAELKRRLAALGISRAVYSEVKDPACDIILAAAEDWAATVHWQPGPSDA
jgi:GrpB-like predicted nucleotidyltransferase (UPF0157 family)